MAINTDAMVKTVTLDKESEVVIKIALKARIEAWERRLKDENLGEIHKAWYYQDIAECYRALDKIAAQTWRFPPEKWEDR